MEFKTCLDISLPISSFGLMKLFELESRKQTESELAEEEKESSWAEHDVLVLKDARRWMQTTKNFRSIAEPMVS